MARMTDVQNIFLKGLTPGKAKDFARPGVKAHPEANRNNRSKVNYTTAVRGQRQPSITRALVKTFLPYFSQSSLLVLISYSANFIGPLLLRSLVSFVEGGEKYSWKGYSLAAVLYCLSLTSTLCLQHMIDCTDITTLKLRGALVNAIYRKILKVSYAARQNVSVGYIINLVSVDVDVLLRSLAQINYIWATPLVVFVGMVLLWQQIGPSCLSGLALLLILLPANSILLARGLKKAQTELMQLKERRLKMTGQVLSGIKVLKLYAWEPYFEARLKDLRKAELLKLRKVTLLINLSFAAWMASPFLVTLVCLVTYTVSSADHILDAQTTFVSMSVINIMYAPLTLFSQAISGAVQAYVSMKRIENFLIKEEIEKPPRHFSSDIISVLNGTFTWENEDIPCLKRINLSVGSGNLVAVVGTVGGGKSSLLSALLGEMKTLSGSVTVQGSVAYVPQEAWVQNRTLRDNILFSSNLNRKKYESVLDSCALRPDLRMIPGGDMAEIGEKGINLSGGQKQRVSLARAVYSDRDIYLLDDPLSAVDVHVGKHLFDEVIGPTGLLRDKTRILVTHSVSHLPFVDSIIVMKDGCISETGTYQELLNNNGAFADFLSEFMAKSESEEGVRDFVESYTGSSESQKKHRKRKTSTISEATTKTAGDFEPMEQLIAEEKTSSGRVELSVFVYLLKAAECLLPCLLLASILLYMATQCVTQLWLRDWSQDQPINGTQNAETVQIRLAVYGGLAVFQLVSIIGMSTSIAFGGMKASFNLHSGLLHSVLRSPMSFFDTTPVGRVLNRFSKDIDAVDQLLPLYTQRFLSNGVSVFSILFIVVYTLPISVAVIGPAAIIILVLQRLNLVVASQLQRLDAICRSPMYSFFEETINGVSSVRAFDYEKEFTERAEKLLNRSQAAAFEVYTAIRLSNSLIQIFGNLIPASTAIFGILNRDAIDPSSIGMALSFSMQFGLMLTWFVRFMSDFEIQMVCVERIKEYSELRPEAAWEVPGSSHSEDWPIEGGVEFQHYETRYRPGLELVLKDISLKIQPCEKVGIVGRTGAGKSSLTLALFRLIEAEKGVILINGEDISKMGLHDVRGRIAIIPQDPVLFCGTLQFNVDPSEERSENEIWNALEHSHLKQFVSSLPNGLQHLCDEGGANLSVGQRQLVCLARALLRMSKILVLDEATAAVDMETDDLIQSTIRSQFQHCTIITIAHRLNTIMDYDRVIVMEDGQIREFDSPGNLTAIKDSLFYGLAKEANLV